eukprot:746002-Hanusia_phi.AAC.3
MGQAEWRDTFDPYGQGRLGCMPFPIEDMILPGETKKLHLYEARFLALFEEALKLHGGCVGSLLFLETGELAQISPLLQIEEWRRLDVGVFVLVKSVGRVKIEAITGMDPYISVIATDYQDQRIVPAHSDEQANNDAVVDDILKLHGECVSVCAVT